MCEERIYTLSLSVNHIPCRAVDISLQCFFVLICHNLSSAIRLAAGSPPTDRRLSSFSHAVFHLPCKHFPSFSHTVITSPLLLIIQCLYLANFSFFSCLSSPFSSGNPIFCHTLSLVLYLYLDYVSLLLSET